MNLDIDTIERMFWDEEKSNLVNLRGLTRATIKAIHLTQFEKEQMLMEQLAKAYSIGMLEGRVLGLEDASNIIR